MRAAPWLLALRVYIVGPDLQEGIGGLETARPSLVNNRRKRMRIP